MINVWILTAIVNGGFTMMPMPSAVACEYTLAALPAAIVESGECYQVEMIERGSKYAPEMAPLPPRKPGQST